MISVPGKLAILGIVAFASACDGSGSTSDASTDGGAGGTTGGGGTGGTTGAGGADGGRGGTGGGAGGTGGSALCGARACTSGELCVHPSCGGAPPVCNPLPDGGQCPAGWIARQSCPFGGGVAGPVCEAPPCTPPASYCVTPPAACGGNPSCACLPRDVCQGGGACSIISGGEVLCASA